MLNQSIRWAQALGVAGLVFVSQQAMAQGPALVAPSEAVNPPTSEAVAPPAYNGPFPVIPGMPGGPAYPPAPAGEAGTAYDTVPPADGSVSMPHSVTTGHGAMTQSRGWSQTDGTYSYTHQQTWTNPDGSLLRQHERTVTGTDPYNYQREQTITLRDGRAINHSQTRTWDGTTGTMERTFSGPNGQTRSMERPWSPEEFFQTENAPAAVASDLPPPEFSPAMAPESLSDAIDSDGKAKKPSWLSKWNPFAKWGKSSEPRSSRSGFTVGSSQRGNSFSAPPGLAKKQAGVPSGGRHLGQQALGRTKSHGPPGAR